MTIEGSELLSPHVIIPEVYVYIYYTFVESGRGEEKRRKRVICFTTRVTVYTYKASYMNILVS